MSALMGYAIPSQLFAPYDTSYEAPQWLIDEIDDELDTLRDLPEFMSEVHADNMREMPGAAELQAKLWQAHAAYDRDLFFDTFHELKTMYAEYCVFGGERVRGSETTEHLDKANKTIRHFGGYA